jgi:ribosomal protein S18 acetylase RimI-like enzyme
LVALAIGEDRAEVKKRQARDTGENVSAMTSFELKVHDLGDLALAPLAAENAGKLGEALAAIPPWSVIGYPAERMTRGLMREQPSVKRFEVMADRELAGLIAIQEPFLHGPYLQLLAVLPAFQGRNVGLRLLRWMEAEARKAEARQLWLCVSAFNERARAFYERFGFKEMAVLDKLATDASDEVFMRKRLSCAGDRRAPLG